MKDIKLYLLALLLISTATACYSQANFALKGGLNVCNGKTEFGFDKWRPTYHIGASVEYPVSDKTSLVGDFLFSDKGDRSKFGDNTHLLYASIPLYVRYGLTKNLSAEAGTGFGYLIASYLKRRSGDVVDQQKILGNRVDWQVNAGFSYSINSQIRLSFRYEHGLTNVINKKTTVSEIFTPIGNHSDPVIDTRTLRDTGWKYYNRNFQFSVCYSPK